MKKIVYLISALVTLSFTNQAQNDTMYIMKAGAIKAKYHLTNQVDSIIFYKPTFSTNGNIFNPNLTYGAVNDQEGNTYKTIAIGTQTWMAENLRSTKYSDGKNIPIVKDNTQWSNSSNNKSPMMSWYNNDQATFTANKYGALYNWYAVSPTTNGNKNVCPTGWHLPTDAEWTTLIDYLGGEGVAGGKMKSTGTQYWSSINTGATNESGFSGLPGGNRNNYGTFNGIGSYGSWWSSMEDGTVSAWLRHLYYDSSNAYRNGTNKNLGYSVRCLED